jgi:hypothetical protein
MPNFVASNLAKAQAKLQAGFQSSELRYRDPVVFKSLIASAQIMIPGYESLRTSEKRVVEAYFKLRQARALGGARSHIHAGVNGDSGTLTPTWTTKTDTFSTWLKAGDSNVYNSPEQLQVNLENVIANMAEGLESDSASFIFNNRSQVNIATADGAFDGVTFAFEIDQATREDRAIQITKSMLYENKYTAGLVDVYCDTVAFNKFMFQANQGSANATNLTFQFNGINFIHSVELNALASGLGYSNGFWVATQQGTNAALPWIPRQNRSGYESREQTYSSLLNPVDGLQYALHFYEEKANGTGFNGELQDEKTEFEVSLDVAFDTAPLSVANETTLLAVALT